MEFTAETIASFLEGTIEGDKNATVNSVAKIEEAKSGELAFLANPKYENFLYSSKASIVIVNRDFEPKEKIVATLIRVENAYSAFSSLLDLYVASKPQKEGVSEKSSIDPTAKIGEHCYIGAFSVIEKGVKIGNNSKIYPNCSIADHCQIGENVTIYSGVNIYENCVIHDNVIVHSGAVIGADGFGFAPDNGKYKKIPQIGNVILEQDVEIGANTCIDRATMGSTVIKRGTKLDNLIQIAHNVVIGEDCVFASQVGIAGSTKVGNSCMFGGQVGIVGHISIANGVQIGSQSGLSNDVKEPNSKILGYPATDARTYARSSAVFRKLPEMSQDISALKKEIESLKSLLNR